MADFVLASLRGGLNNHDPKVALAEDQCVSANNVEFVSSMLGERRRGTSAITLPASLSGKERVSFLHRHEPSEDQTAAELWAFGFTTGGTGALSRKTTSWADITVADTVNLTGVYPYQHQAVSLHGKIFIAKKTNVDRLHCVDAGTTTERRVGLAQPAAPTAADTGVPGTAFLSTRYYRVRYVVVSGSDVLRRSEPSDALTFSPSGTGTAARVTKPATISEGETHWELEASVDGTNFYRIARTVVATTVYDDSQDFAVGYRVAGFPLSEDVGDYTLIGSARYLVVDEDRLVWGGSHDDADLSATVGWSPVKQADGVGDDERMESDTDPTKNLDGLDGGPLTGLTSAVAGEIWATKFKRIFKLVRTGARSKAYDAILMTTAMGALHGSLIPGVDPMGRPCLYALDPAIGPIRMGAGGIMRCGVEISGKRDGTGWASLNLEATKVVCSGLFYPTTQQVIWNIATGSSNVPNLSVVLHTSEQRETKDGLRRGWVTWDGTRASGLAMCLFSSNIEANAARNRTLVPFIGTEATGRLHMCDTGYDDNGTAYTARIRTRPHTLKSLLYKFGVKAAALCAKSVTGALVTVKLIRDFGLDTQKTVTDVSMTPTAAGETDVIKHLDNFAGSELRVAEIVIEDGTSPTARFELNQLALIESQQERMG